MPEFTPEYEALMREIALDHEFRLGDWALVVITISGDRTERWLLNGEALRVVPKVEPKYEGPGKPPIYWLPLEGDWLRMLEEAGHDEVHIRRIRNGIVQYQGQPRSGLICATTPVEPTVARPVASLSGFGLDCLEALARLWMAVTRRGSNDA